MGWAGVEGRAVGEEEVLEVLTDGYGFTERSCGRIERRSSPVGPFAGAVRVEGSPLVGWTSLFPLGALQVGGGTGLVEACLA